MDDVAAEADQLIDALVTGAVADPFPSYSAVRELGTGVHRSTALDAWVVGRYDDVRTMCSDPDTFSSDYFHEMPNGIHDPGRSDHRRYIDISSQQFMLTDDPTHSQVRSILRSTFTPRAISQWKQSVEELTDELLCRFHPGDHVDLVTDLAAEVPVAVIARLLGIPDRDRPNFRKWSEAFVNTFNPMIQGADRDDCIETTLVLFDYLEDLANVRRSRPGDDLISLISTTPTSDGALLSSSSVTAQVALLLAAGNDTTTNLISNTITLLLQNPQTLARVRENPGLIPAAIEESLRCDPPFHLDVRKTARDTELGGHSIPANSVCFQILAAANRDPRRYVNPDQYEIDRAERATAHLAFSHGPHFCIGASLARMEAATVLEKLLDRFPSFGEGATAPRRKVDALIARGWETRPVIL